MTTTTTAADRARTQRRAAVFVSTALSATALAVSTANAIEIRTHAGNRVPACVTPDRLMQFLAANNGTLDRRYLSIARFYKQHGEAWRVRWDYAFFQMAIETNFLAFHRPDGKPGDVNPRQNNFAGLGTTGGGVPGDSYPDISTGVLAQIQHLVAYSGERLSDPIGPRTRLKQDVIVEASLRLGRPVHFADLARRWAVDPRYGQSIAWVADRYRERFCAGRTAESASGSPPAPLSGRSSLGGPPLLDAAPAPARRPEVSSSGAVRTVWRQSRPRETPLLPLAGPVPAPRRVAAVAAAAPAALPPSKITEPIVTPVGPSPGFPADVAMPPPGRIAALAPPPVASRADTPGEVLAIAASAVPFAAHRVVAERQTATGRCRIVVTGLADSRAVLLRASAEGGVELVVLPVVAGFETSAATLFIRARAPGGAIEGVFDDREAALARARDICDARS